MVYEKVLYAAVGAPVVTAKAAQERLTGLRTRLENEAKALRKDARTRMDAWAVEGEKVVNRIADGKMVDEFAARVDFEQAKGQVSKLRDQLEDMLATWRTSFRPGDKPARKTIATQPETVKVETTKPATKPAAKKAAPARKPAAKKAATARKAPAKPAAASA